MATTIYILLVCLKIVSSKINIDITAGSDPGEVAISYTGVDTKVVSDEDIRLFNINQKRLKEAVKLHYGRKPTNCYVKSPTPWGDLYKEHHWEQVTRVLAVKSARIKTVSKKPVIVSTQNLENFGNKTTKGNAGISQSVQNTITTSWSMSNQLTITEEFEYDVNVIFEKATAKIGLSYSVNWGKGEEKSETVTIGTTTAMEVELGPYQAATAVLSATRGYIEAEIVYSASLRGNVAVNFKKPLNDHHFWGPPVQDVMKSGGLKNEVTTAENIKIAFYSDASLKVYDKVTGKPL
jgi:hypothetical protein